MKKLILFSANRQSISDIESGLTGLQLEVYKMRETIAFITESGNISYINGNQHIDFTNAVVYNRFHIIDPLFAGIVHEHLKILGIPFVNEINLQYQEASEKIAQMIRLPLHGILVPETIIVRKEGYESNKNFIESKILYPLICKTNGRKGENVNLINNATELRLYIDDLPAQTRFLIQKYIPNTYDIRIITAFGRVLGGMKRIAQSGSHLNNFSTGGRVEKHIPTEMETELALAATEAAKLDIGGVDIVYQNNTPIVLEVNVSPGVTGFDTVNEDGPVLKEVGRLIEETYLESENK